MFATHHGIVVPKIIPIGSFYPSTADNLRNQETQVMQIVKRSYTTDICIEWSKQTRMCMSSATNKLPQRPCWQKNVFFALPFTSMPDLELPVHPIPTNSNAFMARSPPNSHCHAICLYSCAHQHLHHYFEYYCLC
jgi:hypothetical protein